MLINKWLVSRPQGKNISFLEAPTLEGEAYPSYHAFFEQLALKKCFGGFFFGDTEIPNQGYVDDALKRYNNNMSWVEFSLNGRHGIDYLEIENQDHALDVWISFVVWFEKRFCKKMSLRRLYGMNYQNEFGNDFWFNFCLLRAGMNAPIQDKGAMEYEDPHYYFRVG